jgi:hypothetical protein
MIMKRKHSGSFAVIPNATADDERLSADALGTLVYLLAKPDDWKVIVADLRRRFSMGKDRAYLILKELERVGYVRRFQNRTASNKFATYEYVIYDGPEAMALDATLDRGEPLPEIQEAGKAQQNPASGFTGYGGAASGNQGHILNTKSTKSLREQNSAYAGAETPQEGFEEKKTPIADLSTLPPSKPPSLNKLCWDQAKRLLEKKDHRCILGWIQRAGTQANGLAKLLEILKATERSGTGLPISYVNGCLKKEFPPPPDPKEFDGDKWKFNIQAAINKNDWTLEWGPPPGKKGCLVPPDLITAELTTALARWKAAA